MTYDTFDAADGAAALQNDHDMLQGSTCGDNPVSKKFHINDIISLFSGLVLAREGSAAVLRLAAYMMDGDADNAQTRSNLEKLKICLGEQFAFLSDLQLDAVTSMHKMDPSTANPYITVWLEMQALRFGEEHRVTTYAAWQAKKANISTPANANQHPAQPQAHNGKSASGKS